ncbi:hypothetical protein [Frondihabitans cladoniiphilus]|uniref:Uncharacterized protein n=1 Tax=Frondihabitans cladoniiphilus TaxID=715785 RepID=A0ABP8W3M8_9MICO
MEVESDPSTGRTALRITGDARATARVIDSAGRSVVGGPLFDGKNTFVFTTPRSETTYDVTQHVGGESSPARTVTVAAGEGDGVPSPPRVAVPPLSGTRVVLDVEAAPQSFVQIRDSQKTIRATALLGATGRRQLAVDVPAGQETRLQVTATLGAHESAARKILVAPAPVIATDWSGTTGAILRIARGSGDVTIYDSEGSEVAFRLGSSPTDSLVTVPLTGASTSFTAVRSSGGFDASPLPLDVASENTALAPPTVTEDAFGRVTLHGQPWSIVTVTPAEGEPLTARITSAGATGPLALEAGVTHEARLSVERDESSALVFTP